MVTNWKVRRRRWILRLMAATIILLVVVHRANTYTVVNATDTMSATAGKTHRAHLHPAYIHVWCAVILYTLYGAMLCWLTCYQQRGMLQKLGEARWQTVGLPATNIQDMPHTRGQPLVVLDR